LITYFILINVFGLASTLFQVTIAAASLYLQVSASFNSDQCSSIIERFHCAMNIIIICQKFGLGPSVQIWWPLQSY